MDLNHDDRRLKMVVPSQLPEHVSRRDARATIQAAGAVLQADCGGISKGRWHIELLQMMKNDDVEDSTPGGVKGVGHKRMLLRKGC